MMEHRDAPSVEQPRPLAGASARLVLRTLFLHASPLRASRLREAAVAVGGDWAGVVPALEMHGVLPLALRNLRAADAPVPPQLLAQLAARDCALREDARRSAFTVLRVVEGFRKAQIDAVLLKGSSLAVDRYADAALRSQGDVDVLVDVARVRDAVAAAAAIGLVPSDRELPAWWYRLAHFHLKLHPASALMKEVEIHWELHHPSLLHVVDLHELRCRCRRVDSMGERVFTLDPVDRILHLATHAVSHWRGIPADGGEEILLEVLREPGTGFRLKWLVDLQAEIEAHSSSGSACELRRRAQEWNAEAELDGMLRLVRRGLEGESWRGGSEEGLALGSAQCGSAVRAAGANIGATGPVAFLDVRAASLLRWPRWLFPPRRYLLRRYGAPARSWIRILLLRVRHASWVIARTALAAAALPVALVGSVLLRRSRRKQRAAALQPERVLDLVASWKSQEKKSGEARAEPS